MQTAPSPQRLRTWLRGELKRIKLRQAWNLIVVLALAVTAAFGGLDTVDPTVTHFQPGQPFNDGEYTVTIIKAKTLRDVTRGYKHHPGKIYLAIAARIRNNGTIPGRLEEELDLRDQPQQNFQAALRLDDSPATDLGPGLTETLVFVWELPDTAVRPGETVTLRIYKKVFYEMFVLYGKDWMPTSTYGQVVVPVKGIDE